MHIIIKPRTIFTLTNMIEDLITTPYIDEVGKFPRQKSHYLRINKKYYCGSNTFNTNIF